MGSCCKPQTRKAPNLDPVPQSEPYSKPVRCVTARLTIHKDSVKLIPHGPDTYYLEFTYSADYDCKLTVYWMCRETTGKGYKRLELEAGRLKPVTYVVSKGSKQVFPQQTLSVTTTDFAETELTFQDKLTFPLVFELYPHDFQSQYLVQWSYLAFYQEADVWKVRVIQQKLQVGEHLFETLDVFGVEEERKDCVICMTQERCIVVLPCRHLCLCAGCTKDFSEQSSKKCPICRCDVEGLLSVR